MSLHATFPSSLRKVIWSAGVEAVKRRITWLPNVFGFWNGQEGYLRDEHLKSILKEKVLAGKKETVAPIIVEKLIIQTAKSRLLIPARLPGKIREMQLAVCVTRWKKDLEHQSRRPPGGGYRETCLGKMFASKAAQCSIFPPCIGCGKNQLEKGSSRLDSNQKYRNW